MLNTIRIIRDINVEKESPWNIIEDMIREVFIKYGKFLEEESLLILGFDVYKKFHSECVNVMPGGVPKPVRFLFFKGLPIIKSCHLKFMGKVVLYAFFN